MKKLKIIIIGLILTILVPINVHAASGNINVSGASTVVVGNRVTVTVTLSSGTSIGSWQMDLNYDKNYLQLTGSNAEGGGTRMVNSSATGVKSKSYTFTFKALKSGNTRVSVSSYLAYAYSDISEISLTSGSKNIRIMTQAELEASYSKDNNLKALSVEGYELDKAFDKDTLEYTINVPTGTTSVNITATKNDSRASVTGAGEVEVTEGLNTIPIIVTAQNGSEKTYTLIINVEDQNPIQVKVGNEDYVIVKTASLLTAPNTFNSASLTINGIEIPAFKNDAANITLVGLKDSTGTIGLYIYDNDKYSKYNEMNLDTLLLIPVAFEKQLDFTKTTVNINGEKVDAYQYSGKSNLVIISAKNLVDGKTNLYLYDTENNNAIHYDEELINLNNSTLQLYTYVIIAFASVCFLMLIIIMGLLHSSKKKQKKINKFIERQEAKIEATRKLNDVVSEVQKITSEEKKQAKKIEKDEQKLAETKKLESVKNAEPKINDQVSEKETKSKEKGDLTMMLETLSEEQIKEASKEMQIDRNELSKKELKELKKLEKQKAKAEKKKNNNNEDKVIINEIKVDNSKDINKLSEDTEEVYDLFEDDKKKKKK